MGSGVFEHYVAAVFGKVDIIVRGREREKEKKPSF